MPRNFSDNTPFGSKIVDNINSQVSPIFSTKPIAKYSSGARVTLRINNQLIGFAFSINWKIETQQEEIYTIDDYLPYEMAPNRISVEGTIGAFHIPGRGPSAELFQSNILSFLTHRYIVIEVRDSQSNDLLFYAPKAVITTRSESINAENLGKMTLGFKAIGWQDEKEPKLQPTQQQTEARAATSAEEAELDILFGERTGWGPGDFGNQGGGFGSGFSNLA